MLLGGCGILLHLQPQTGGLPFLRLHLLALALHLAQHVLKLDVLPIQMPACQLNDVLRQTQSPGDGESVGLAGDADEQAIGGTEGLHVELTGGVLHPGGGHGVQLQFGVVGGGHDLGAQAPGLLDDGRGQRRALHRVGAGTQFVEEQQRPVVGLPQHLDDVGDMGGKGGQGLLDGLLVPDVRQDFFENGHLAPVVHRQVQAALGHEGEQASRFQGDRLTAGVGAGDDQGVKALPQFQVDGHCLLLVQQRMPGVAEHEPAVLHQFRLHAVHLIGQLAPGEDQVQRQQQVVIL